LRRFGGGWFNRRALAGLLVGAMWICREDGK
jgi:hypothetical protein